MKLIVSYSPDFMSFKLAAKCVYRSTWSVEYEGAPSVTLSYSSRRASELIQPGERDQLWSDKLTFDDILMAEFTPGSFFTTVSTCTRVTCRVKHFGVVLWFKIEERTILAGVVNSWLSLSWVIGCLLDSSVNSISQNKLYKSRKERARVETTGFYLHLSWGHCVCVVLISRLSEQPWHFCFARRWKHSVCRCCFNSRAGVWFTKDQMWETPQQHPLTYKNDSFTVYLVLKKLLLVLDCLHFLRFKSITRKQTNKRLVFITALNSAKHVRCV